MIIYFGPCTEINCWLSYSGSQFVKKWDKFERIEYVQYADWSTFSGLQFFSTERCKEGWYQQKFGKLAAHYDPREPRGCNLQNLPLRPIGEHLGKTSLNKNITIKVIIDLRNLSLISAHGIGICLLNTQLKIQKMSKSHQSIWVVRDCFTLTHLPKITRHQARRSEDDFSYTQLCSLIIDSWYKGGEKDNSLPGRVSAHRLGGLDNSELYLRKLFRLDALVTPTGKHIAPRIYGHFWDDLNDTDSHF